VLLDIGVPLSKDSKYDWTYLKDKITEKLESKDSMKDKNVQQLERFVQRVRMICQQIIQQDKQGISMYKEAPATIDEDAGHKHKRQKTGEEDKQEIAAPSEAKSKNEEDDDQQNLQQFSYFEDCGDFNPDNDGFSIDFDLANKLHKRLNILYFIRKELLPNKAKVFMSKLDDLKKDYMSKKASLSLPANWDPERHDKAFLYALSDNGFNYLAKIADNLDNSK